MTTYREGGDAKETRRADRPATEGNRESGLHPSPDPKPVPSPVYPDRAGGGERPVAVGQTETPALPPPALKVGDRIELHEFSCLSPQQHERSAVGGSVIAVFEDGWLVRLDRPVEMFGGDLIEGAGPLRRIGSCPNAVAAASEVAA